MMRIQRTNDVADCGARWRRPAPPAAHPPTLAARPSTARAIYPRPRLGPKFDLSSKPHFVHQRAPGVHSQERGKFTSPRGTFLPSACYVRYLDTVLSRGTKLLRGRQVLVLKLQSNSSSTSTRVRSCIGLTRVEVSSY